MVKLITKFKKRQGGLSGKTITDEFRTVAEAKRHKKFLRGTFVSSTIVARKRRKKKKRTLGSFLY